MIPLVVTGYSGFSGFSSGSGSSNVPIDASVFSSFEKLEQHEKPIFQKDSSHISLN